MAKLHRRDLKQDEVREKFAEAMHGVKLHGREILYIVLVVLAVGLTAFLWYLYENHQQTQSQALLGVAMDKFQSPVSTQPPGPQGFQPLYNYKTEAQKYTDAEKDFEQILKKYPNTSAGDIARYQAGVCAFYLKDYKKAEDDLLQSSKISDQNILYFQSRIALTNLYTLTGKPQQAEQYLNEAIAKDKNQVPPEYLLFLLAESYEKGGKAKQARATYQKILDQYKDSPISYQAQIRLNEMSHK
jgi:tetratricopeptide (TPR) repeat protein